MPAPNIGQVLATTWERVVGESPEEQYFKDRWLFDRLTTKNGGMVKVQGGSPIQVPLSYTYNTTFRSYSDTEVLDVQRVDVVDAAEFDWKEHSGTVTYSVIQEFRNSGEGGKVDLIAHLVENAIQSHKDDISTAMFGDGTGNGGKNILGLRALVPDAPGSAGLLGGINRNNFSFWRSLQASGAKGSTDWDKLRGAMRKMYNDCSLGIGGEAPSFIVCDQAVFEGYESLLVAGERYDMDDKKNGADAGYNGAKLKFKGAQIAYDIAMASSARMYFLNEKFIKLYVAKNIWMKLGKEQEPINQHIRVRKVHSILQMLVKQPRRLGVLTSCS